MQTRPTRAYIDLNALEHNFLEIKKRLPEEVKILAVVKADAYGHGAIEISKKLETLGCDMLGVALCEEGIELRKAGINSPIIVLSGIYRAQIKDIVRYNLTPVIFDIDQAGDLNHILTGMDKSARVHVKIDTGMGRLGLMPNDISKFFNEIKELKSLKIEGVLSHFTEADKENKLFTKDQFKRFEDVIKTINDMGITPSYRHISNSAAIINFPSSYLNLVRPGIMLYGSHPAEAFRDKIDLLPVMSLTTEIIQLKWVPKNYPISYSRTFITQRDSLIATIPIGYGDGYFRSLSGKADVLVKGKRVPVAGRICMDMTMIDVTNLQAVKVGDKVTIIGRQNGEEITAEELASRAGTISYEIFCSINQRVPRVYIEQ
ncbi:MAG: alanine racemase [Thermodesulfobacteriota bacterium]